MAPPPPGLPTWKILPSADGGYRWVPVPPLSAVPPPQTPDPPAPRLPSFSDFLLQAEKKLIGCSAVAVRDVGGGDLGDAIPAPRGARRREEGIIEEKNVDGLVSMFAKGSGEGGGSPMFTTGSGRSVKINPSSIQKAASVLGCKDGAIERRGIGNAVPEAGSSLGGGGQNGCGGAPMFQTGSGRSVTVRKSSMEKAAALLGGGEGVDRGERPSRKLLGEITNIVASSALSEKNFVKRKNGFRSGASASPFKKPRTSRFTTPLKKNSSILHINDHPASKDLSHKPKLSSHYPPQFAKMSLKDFLGKPPCYHGLFQDFSMEINAMTPDKAEKYEFTTTGGSGTIGIESITDMLLQSGASLSNLTKELDSTISSSGLVIKQTIFGYLMLVRVLFILFTKACQTDVISRKLLTQLINGQKSQLWQSKGLRIRFHVSLPVKKADTGLI